MKTLEEYLKGMFDDPEFLARWEEKDRQLGFTAEFYRDDFVRQNCLRQVIVKTVPEMIELLRNGTSRERLADIYHISLDQIRKIEELGERMGQGSFDNAEIAKWFDLPVELVNEIRTELYPLGPDKTALISKERLSMLKLYWDMRTERNEEACRLIQQYLGDLSEIEQELLNVWDERVLAQRLDILAHPRRNDLVELCKTSVGSGSGRHLEKNKNMGIPEISQLSPDQLNAELEKGFAEISSGEGKKAEAVFCSILTDDNQE